MFVSNALIGLREGLEAALVVVILLAFLTKTNRTWGIRYVWLGVGTAVALSVVLGASLTYGTRQLSFEAQELIGGLASIIAVGFVTAMVFWMKSASRTISGELKGKLDRALDLGPLAVALVAFLGVGREGLETAIFFYATAQAAGAGNNLPLLGWVVGFAGAILLGLLIYKGALKINLGAFFKWTGIALILVAGGILSYGIHDLQEAGVLPGLNNLAFDVSGTIDPSSWYATLLKGTLNFTPATTVLQAVAWVLYVGTVMFFFLRPSKPARPGRAGRRLPPSRSPPPPDRRPGRPARPRRTSNPCQEILRASPQPRPRRRARGAGTRSSPAAPPTRSRGPRVTPITVKATDTACELSRTEAPAGQVEFTVTNAGSKVNEFYVYAENDRIVGEVENISPGLTRTFHVDLSEPGEYQTACKPGMVGDGIRAPFTVTGSSAAPTGTDATLTTAVTQYQQFVAGQADAFLERTTEFVALVKAGKVDEAKALYPVARSHWERIEPVAESFGDLDPKIDGREEVVAEGMPFTGYHRLEKDLWVDGLQPDSGAIADQLLADVTELVTKAKAVAAQPAAAGQRLQGAARRDGHRQDHRGGGALQPHRPVGLRRQLRGLAGRDRGAAPVPQGQEPHAARDDRPAGRRPRRGHRRAQAGRRVRALHRADPRRPQGPDRGARRVLRAGGDRGR